MSQYLLKKRIFAIVFLVILFVFSAANFAYNKEKLMTEVLNIIQGGISAEEISGFEGIITENLYKRMTFIEGYGLVQRILDKRECNNFSYIMDENGFLHYASFYREADAGVFEYAMRVKRMQDYVGSKGTKVLFVVPPGKYNKNYTKFRMGMPVNNPDPIVDEMLLYLNRLGIEALDLRESFPNAELSYEETFFKTDHHWTIPAAFYAMGQVVNKIEECFGRQLDKNGYYTDINNYDIVTYKSGMLGSMGRRTGAVYCGVEDFTALFPKFEGNFTRESMSENGKLVRREGNFEECLMEMSMLTQRKDIYSDSQYSSYLNGLRVYEKIINEDNPQGCKLFMIRDSYFSPVMAFLMPMCGQIDAIWSLEDTPELDIEAYVKENDFDYIIMEVYPYNINSSAFNFFKN